MFQGYRQFERENILKYVRKRTPLYYNSVGMNLLNVRK